MTRRSDGDGEPAGVDPRFDPAFQRAASPGPSPRTDPVPVPGIGADVPAAPAGEGDPPPQPMPSVGPRDRPTDGPALAAWLAPVLWILAVAFPAAGLGLRALAAGITTSMPYSSFGDPLGERWLLELVPLLVTLAPGVVAGGPMAVIAALAVHALRRRPSGSDSGDPGVDRPRA
ncbi:hypothetical protein [Clavibacter sp. VKM Ac-2872]|uniref:hypothetical protein n=1 Tax=Clavibacter sp. VKM Ac-2872 TaxID=2783812 RepID=UPI001E3B232C|nr:hypothetical protein [Clavibacter sp. VKM Ac-2872]